MDSFFGWADLSLATVMAHVSKLSIAYVLALPIGWNRESEARSAGLRTFPLVSVATCAYMLVGMEVLSSTDAEARAMYGIVTGMGFIGGGAILKTDGHVSGTATAASLWNTGAIGLAIAWGRLEIALLLTALNVLTLTVGSRVKSLVRK